MIEVDHLTKQYKAGQPIFSDVTKTFGTGTAVGLIGANGSGKTTFLRLLSVNSFPTSGKILYNEIDIHENPAVYLKDVGLVHDEEALPLHLTAVELLEWILRSRNKWNGHSSKKIYKLFERLALAELEEPIGTYSTGMKKKTQIAAAFITNPKILIMDEPLRGLDEPTRTSVVQMIVETKKNQNTLIFMASHSMNTTGGIFDEIMEFPL